MNYSVLIIALECHYSHVTRFIKYLKSTNPSVDISLFTDKAIVPDEIKENTKEIIYREWSSPKRGIKIKAVSKLFNKWLMFKQFKELSKQRHFDIINVHFAQYYMAFVVPFLKRMSTKLILTPWGSDILRVSSKMKILFLKRLYQNADMITTGTEYYLGNYIIHTFHVDAKNMRSLRWGSETIDYINDYLVHITKDDAKRELGLAGYYIITCGYNAFQEQRHEQMIRAIYSIREHLPEKTVLFFPVTYGRDSKKREYIQHLKYLCEDLGLQALFYEEYLEVKVIFLLRRSSDMFIHVQTTDAGNSSIMEYCICGNKIIHGSWIYYKWMDRSPIFYFPVDDLNELPHVILNAYKSHLPALPGDVISTIKSRGWKERMVEWDEAFTRLLQQ